MPDGSDDKRVLWLWQPVTHEAVPVKELAFQSSGQRFIPLGQSPFRSVRKPYQESPDKTASRRLPPPGLTSSAQPSRGGITGGIGGGSGGDGGRDERQLATLKAQLVEQDYKRKLDNERQRARLLRIQNDLRNAGPGPGRRGQMEEEAAGRPQPMEFEQTDMTPAERRRIPNFAPPPPPPPPQMPAEQMDLENYRDHLRKIHYDYRQRAEARIGEAGLELDQSRATVAELRETINGLYDDTEKARTAAAESLAALKAKESERLRLQTVYDNALERITALQRQAVEHEELERTHDEYVARARVAEENLARANDALENAQADHARRYNQLEMVRAIQMREKDRLRDRIQDLQDTYLSPDQYQVVFNDLNRTLERLRETEAELDRFRGRNQNFENELAAIRAEQAADLAAAELHIAQSQEVERQLIAEGDRNQVALATLARLGTDANEQIRLGQRQLEIERDQRRLVEERERFAQTEVERVRARAIAAEQELETLRESTNALRELDNDNDTLLEGLDEAENALHSALDDNAVDAVEQFVAESAEWRRTIDDRARAFRTEALAELHDELQDYPFTNIERFEPEPDQETVVAEELSQPPHPAQELDAGLAETSQELPAIAEVRANEAAGALADVVDDVERHAQAEQIEEVISDVVNEGQAEEVVSDVINEVSRRARHERLSNVIEDVVRRQGVKRPHPVPIVVDEDEEEIVPKLRKRPIRRRVIYSSSSSGEEATAPVVVAVEQPKQPKRLPLTALTRVPTVVVEEPKQRLPLTTLVPVPASPPAAEMEAQPSGALEKPERATDRKRYSGLEPKTAEDRLRESAARRQAAKDAAVAERRGMTTTTTTIKTPDGTELTTVTEPAPATGGNEEPAPAVPAAKRRMPLTAAAASTAAAPDVITPSQLAGFTKRQRNALTATQLDQIKKDNATRLRANIFAGALTQLPRRDREQAVNEEYVHWRDEISQARDPRRRSALIRDFNIYQQAVNKRLAAVNAKSDAELRREQMEYIDDEDTNDSFINDEIDEEGAPIDDLPSVLGEPNAE